MKRFSSSRRLTFQGGAGELRVNLPVEMDTALVTVTIKGLIQGGNRYVNETLGTAPHILRLNLQAGVGSTHLAVP